MGRSQKSRYVLVIENLSSVTRSRDIKAEAARFGAVQQVERDVKERAALVDFKSSKDAAQAWKKLDGVRIDGREWKVDWATRKDFDFFSWEWFEEEEGSPQRGARSPSRSPGGA